MGLWDAFRGAKKTAREKDQEIIEIEALDDLTEGCHFTLDVCDVDEISSRTFYVARAWNYAIDTDQRKTSVFEVECIATGNTYRLMPITIAGRKYYRMDREITPEEVDTLFIDQNWEYIDDPDAYVPPSDFRFLFDDDVRANFVLNRYVTAEEATGEQAQLLDWTADSYRFSDYIGVEGYRYPRVKGSEHIRNQNEVTTLQCYFLVDSLKQYGVYVDVFEDGVTKVYVGHLVKGAMFSSLTPPSKD